jgi:hypothetical protein
VSREEGVIRFESKFRFLNKVIQGAPVGGTGEAKDELLPVVVGHARGLPLRVFNKALLQYKVSASQAWEAIPSHRWKDMCAVWQEGRPLYRAPPAGAALTPVSTDEYLCAVPHELNVGDVVDLSVFGVSQYRYVVSVSGGMSLAHTNFKVSATRGGAPLAHFGVTPVIQQYYNYSFDRITGIVELNNNPGAVQSYADFTAATVNAIRPYVISAEFPYRASKIGRVLESLAATYGGINAGAFDVHSFDAADAQYADATHSVRIGTVATERLSLAEEMERLARGVGAYIMFDDDGKLRCGYMHSAAQLVSPVAVVDGVLVKHDQEFNYARIVPTQSTVTLRYLRNETTISQFVGAATENEKLERAAQYPRSVTSPPPSWDGAWPRLTNNAMDSPFTAADNLGPTLATAVGAWAVVLRDVNGTYSFEVSVRADLKSRGLQLGDVVSVPMNERGTIIFRNGWVTARTLSLVGEKYIDYKIVVKYV